MSKVLSGFCLLLVLVLTPSTTRADPLVIPTPIVITNGSLSITGVFGGQRYFLEGDNFSMGGVGLRGVSAPQGCSPCLGGSPISINGFFVGDSLGLGGATINGIVFPDVSFGGTFTFTGPPLMVPVTATDVTLTSPFTFTGARITGCPPSGCVSLPLFTVELVGSGIATLDLKFSGFDNQGRPLFLFQNVNYQFEVPEPVSILLLGSGLALLGAGIRSRRKG